MKGMIRTGAVLFVSAAMAFSTAGQISVRADENEPILVMIWGEENQPYDTADNALSHWVEEEVKRELGISAEIVRVSQATGTEELEKMLLNQEAPDIFYTNQEGVLRFAEQGLLADLTEAFEAYGDNIRAMGDFQHMGVIDGKQYALVGRAALQEAMIFSYIRKDWLDILGMDIPGTKEELIEYLYAVKEKNPGNVDGVIPWAICGREDQGKEYLGFVGSYVTLDSEREAYLYAEEYMAVAPGALDGIRQLNTLYHDGILSPDFITDTGIADNRRDRQVKRGQAGFMTIGMHEAWDLIGNMNGKREEWTFIPVQCFELEDGSYRTLMSPEYNYEDTGFLCVPAYSQAKAEECVRYLNWMADPEVAEDVMYGPDHPTDAYGVPIKRGVDEYKALGYTWFPYTETLSLMNRHLNYEDTREGMTAYWRANGLSAFADDEWLNLQWDVLQTGQFRFPTFPLIPQAERDCGETVKSGIIQYVYRLISCEPDEFDSLQETLYRELEEEGLAEILKERAEYYDGQK